MRAGALGDTNPAFGRERCLAVAGYKEDVA